MSGCLAAYRRESIARFISIWAKDKTQYGDDRNLTTYAIATPWAKRQLAPVEMRLLKSMSEYDDAEDRGLTSQTVVDWETVYAPTAIVYTEVPDRWRTYLRQQIRWKKGYLRSTFFVSAFDQVLASWQWSFRRQDLGVAVRRPALWQGGTRLLHEAGGRAPR